MEGNQITAYSRYCMNGCADPVVGYINDALGERRYRILADYIEDLTQEEAAQVCENLERLLSQRAYMSQKQRTAAVAATAVIPARAQTEMEKRDAS